MHRHLWIGILSYGIIVLGALSGCQMLTLNDVPVTIRSEGCDLGEMAVEDLLISDNVISVEPLQGPNAGSSVVTVNSGYHRVNVPLGCQVEFMKARNNDMTFTTAIIYDSLEMQFERNHNYVLVAMPARSVESYPEDATENP